MELNVMMIVLENLLDMIGASPVSFRRKPESRLIQLAWIPARAPLGRDDAPGIFTKFGHATAEAER
jgi:hypothetical protein